MEFDKINLRNRLFDYDRIYIYGVGEYGRTLAGYLDDLGLFKYIDAFVVTEPCRREKVLGKKIYFASEMVKGGMTQDVKTLVYIAASQGKHQEILNAIKKEWNWDTVCMMYSDYTNMKNATMQINSEDKSKLVKEVTDFMKFETIIRDSKWLINKDIVPGGMAVSSKYMYLLFKILDSGKFSAFLDIGLGQTSRLMGQYANSHPQIMHTIIEADKEWISFFEKTNGCDINNSEIRNLNYAMEEKEECKVRIFEDFGKEIANHKFDFISIDAPLGGDMTKYSRMDILNSIPGCLKKSWIIMMDDTGRIGERNTLTRLKEKLHMAKIEYMEQQFKGVEKDFTILVSVDNKFFRSI